MHRIAVATALYPQPESVARQFGEGVAALAAAEEGIVLVAAVEDGTDAAAFVPPDCAVLDIRLIKAGPGVTGASLRQAMVDAAAASDAAWIVFADCDDVLDPAAGARHRAALAGAEISYGDMALIDAEGAPLPGRLYGGATPPDRIETSDALLRRNVIGLSNSAVRRDTLARCRPRIPDSVTAVDWYLATVLVDSGARARRADGTVGFYRQHGHNTLGAGAAVDAAAMANRTAVAIRHFEALPATPARCAALGELVVLRAALNDRAEWVQDLLTDMDAGPLWYEDVFAAADKIQAAGSWAE